MLLRWQAGHSHCRSSVKAKPDMAHDIGARASRNVIHFRMNADRAPQLRRNVQLHAANCLIVKGVSHGAYIGKWQGVLHRNARH